MIKLKKLTKSEWFIYILSTSIIFFIGNYLLSLSFFEEIRTIPLLIIINLCWLFFLFIGSDKYIVEEDNISSGEAF